MRELKFRVWDSSDKEWSSLNTSIGYSHNKCYFDLEGSKYQRDNCIIQQYTGLKDKNGKDIYEGDIVKYSRCHVVSIEQHKNVFSSKAVEDGDFIGEIIFIFPSFCWSYNHKRYDDIEPMTRAYHRYEVIGNIFETPELLKDE